jgi:hypothetical protein
MVLAEFFFSAVATTIFLSPSSSWPLDSRQRIMERGAMDAHIYTRAELGDHPVYPQESQLTPACDPLVVTELLFQITIAKSPQSRRYFLSPWPTRKWRKRGALLRNGRRTPSSRMRGEKESGQWRNEESKRMNRPPQRAWHVIRSPLRPTCH